MATCLACSGPSPATWSPSDAAAFANMALRAAAAMQCAAGPAPMRHALWPAELMPFLLQQLNARSKQPQQLAQGQAASGCASVGGSKQQQGQGRASGVADEDPEPPPHFVCPVTQAAMREPVVAADGYTYERAAIEDWLRRRGRATPTSPMTNAPLPHPMLTPVHTLRSAIMEWELEQRRRARASGSSRGGSRSGGGGSNDSSGGASDNGSDGGNPNGGADPSSND